MEESSSQAPADLLGATQTGVSEWERLRSANQRNWDARVPIHVGPKSRYAHDMAMVTAGKPALQPTEREDLAKLVTPSTTVLHLQCHIGTDTLSLLHLGAARVVGLDFSAPALEAAKKLAQDAGISESRARWVQSDVYNAVAALESEKFDLVFCSVGTLCWLPNIDAWGAIVGKCLKPGGHFYIRDGHPMAMTLATDDQDAPGFKDRPRDKYGARDLIMTYVCGWLIVLDRMPMLQLAVHSRAVFKHCTYNHVVTHVDRGAGCPGTGLACRLPYFETREPTTFVSNASYCDDSVIEDENAHTTHEWNHPLGAIITSLVGPGGLHLCFCREHQDIDWQFMDHMVQREGHHGRFGGWELPAHQRNRCPLMYSLLARKPGIEGQSRKSAVANTS